MEIQKLNRKLQLLYDEETHSTVSAPEFMINYPPLLPQALPAIANVPSSSPPLVNKPNTPFDSSMALTIIVLVSALFFMAFFSNYVRHFSDNRRRGGHGSSDHSSSRKGLDPLAIGSLPVFAYNGTSQIDCAICLAEFEEQETVKLIPHCKHVFHQECIDTWLSSHITCPVCRRTLLSDVEGSRTNESNDITRITSESASGSTVATRDATPDFRRSRSYSSIQQIIN